MEIRNNVPKGKPVPTAELRKNKVAMLSEVYRILSFCLGEPPTTFSWRYQDKTGKLVTSATFTPQIILSANGWYQSERLCDVHE